MKSNLLVLDSDKFITNATDLKTDLARASIYESILKSFKDIYRGDQSDLILITKSQDEIKILQVDTTGHYYSSGFYDLKRLTQTYQTVVFFNVFEHRNTIECFNVLRNLIGSTHHLFVFNQKPESTNRSISSNLYSSKNLKLMLQLFGYNLLGVSEPNPSEIYESISSDSLNNKNNGRESQELNKLYLEWSHYHHEPHTVTMNSLNPILTDKHLETYECIVAERGTHPKNTIYAGYINKKTAVEYDVLFRHCFGHEPTPGLWNFKFNKKSGYSLGLFEQTDDGQPPKLIAHYGGLKRKIHYFGEPKLALQIGDVMVDAMGIKSLSRKGPFFNLVSIFLEQHIGYGREALLGFGFPNQKHMKIATLLGLYSEVESMNEISWMAQKLRIPFWYELIQLDEYNHSKYTIFLEILWKKMSLDLKYSILGIRDASYIEHRYFNRPGKNYQLYLIKNRFIGLPKGLLIFNHDINRFELIDIIAPIKNIPLLVNLARDIATKHVSKKLLLRITSNFVKIFRTDDSTINSLDISIPANIHTQGPSAELLTKQWWLMSGDMDYV